MKMPQAIAQVTLSGEEKNAIAWRIRHDYAVARQKAEPSHETQYGTKNAYISFAFHFYSRSRPSIDAIVEEYRVHFKEMREKLLAEAFMNDLLHKVQLGDRELQAA